MLIHKSYIMKIKKYVKLIHYSTAWRKLLNWLKLYLICYLRWLGHNPGNGKSFNKYTTLIVLMLKIINIKFNIKFNYLKKYINLYFFITERLANKTEVSLHWMLINEITRLWPFYWQFTWDTREKNKVVSR